MAMDVLLPLFISVPLAASAIAVLLPWRLGRDLLHIIVPFAGIFAGIWLFAYTAEHGPIAHNVGLYVGGIAIPFAADTFSAIMLITTSIVAVAANWFATTVGETRARFYPALTLMLITGVNGALLTADLFNFFVFIEVMLLPSYGLIAMTGTWARLASGRIFVLVNLSASTMLVAGVAIVYGVVGSVNIAALHDVIQGNPLAAAAMGIVIIAISVKAGIFPVHTWLPRTYPGTSAAVMGLFSGMHTKVAVYMLYRIWVHIFDMDPTWNWLIIAIMVASMLIGGFAGLGENSIRRVLAYQMVNGMPFILIMMAFTSDDPQRALAAGLFYALHHMITIAALVLTAGAIEETYGTGMLAKLSGLARREPLVAAVFAAGAFSVVGFPPFSGMWGKALILLEIARVGNVAAWITIATIIIASVGALLSMIRVWREVFWGGTMHQRGVSRQLRISTAKIAPAIVLVSLSVGMFIFAGPLIDATLTATDGLLNTDAYQYSVLGDDAVGVPSPSYKGGN